MPSTTFNLPAPLHHIHCRDCGSPGHASCGQGRFAPRSIEPSLPSWLEPLKPADIGYLGTLGRKTCPHGETGYCFLCGK